jgi:hypothetical protein
MKELFEILDFPLALELFTLKYVLEVQTYTQGELAYFEIIKEQKKMSN